METVSEEQNQELEIFNSLPEIHKLQIAEKNEPGEKLYLCLRIARKDDGTFVPNQEVLLYHTSAKGQYQPINPGDESTARLSGRVVTDPEGRAFIQTILPGDYGSSSDNRHIHTTVFGARPEAYDIHFKQYTGFMGKNFIDDSDQHFLADLKRLEDGALVSFLTIEVKNL
ncbi:MAG: hypothetical protein AAF391_10530 [Bacteroidota bacterium]